MSHTSVLTPPRTEIEIEGDDREHDRPRAARGERAVLAIVVLLMLGVAPIAVRAALADAPPRPEPAPAPAPAPTPAPPRAAPPETAASLATTAATSRVAAVPPGVGDGLERRLVSQDGRFEAWAEPLPPGGTIYAPGGRASSRIDVYDQLTGTVATLAIDRNIEPEAFSPDGAFLYVIDHLPALDPTEYKVGSVDLRSGDFASVGPPKVPGPEEVMRGLGREQVWAPDGTQLYTLYVRQFHDHSDSSHRQGLPEAAFIHVLDVATGWAMCLDLPHGFGLGPPGSTGIMVSPDGTTITVVDHHLGQRVDVTRVPPANEWEPVFEISPPMPL